MLIARFCACFSHTGEHELVTEKSVYVKKVRFFFRARKNAESGNHGDSKVRRETPLPGCAEPSREVRRVAIGRGRINPTIKLRLPRGKARQIAWMSTVSGNHDQIVSLRISGATDVSVKEVPFWRDLFSYPNRHSDGK